MKLIIDIDENVYTRLCDNGRPMDIADGIVMDRAIRNGTPIPDNETNEIMDIVNNPSKHIKMIKVDGEETICYSQQFVKLLELLERTISESRKVKKI